MSFTVSSLTEYVDQSSTELLTAAVAKGRTAELVTVMPNVKHKKALQKFATTVTFQDDSCAFSASDTTTFTQRTLLVDPIVVQEALCPKDLEDKWTQLLLSAGSEYDESDIPAMYMEQKMKVLQDEIEKAIWGAEDGVGAGNLGFTDGFLMKIDGDGAALCIDGNVSDAASITASNAIQAFQDVYSVIPEAILDSPDLVAFCGWDTFRSLIQNITDNNWFHYVSDDAARTGEMYLPGTNLRIVATTGLTGLARIVAAETTNLVIGTDVLEDSSSMEMWASLDDRNVKSNIAFKLGVEIPFLEEVVEWTAYPS